MQLGLNAFVETIGSRLKFARKKRTLTQGELGSRAHVKQSDISKIERGGTQRPKTLLALARALRCNPDWLDTGVGDWEAESVSDLSTALGLLSDRIKKTNGVARAAAVSALEYFLQHPDEWQQVADQIDNAPGKAPTLGGEDASSAEHRRKAA